MTPVGTRSAPETALREQVLAQLRTIVAKAVDGSRLPTVRKLMADLGASQYVVQAALEQLREEGQIVSHVGRGTFKAGGGREGREPDAQRAVAPLSPPL